MTVPSRAELREHLIRTMIAGDVATPRQSNLLHYRRMAKGDPYYRFGLDLKRSWTEREVLEMMVRMCGVNPDRMHLYGDDTIDPDKTIRYEEGMVAALEDDDGRLHHTHDPFPMEAMLSEAAGTSNGSDSSAPAESKNWPDLAIADHGWAGAAGQAGIDTVGFADCNDPALFAGEVEGRILVTVPMDDGVHPACYEPLTAYLMSHAGLIA